MDMNENIQRYDFQNYFHQINIHEAQPHITKTKTTSNCIKKNKELVIDGIWYILDI